VFSSLWGNQKVSQRQLRSEGRNQRSQKKGGGGFTRERAVEKFGGEIKQKISKIRYSGMAKVF
jgi:hypothetical protein